jgi:hypothetical protein
LGLVLVETKASSVTSKMVWAKVCRVSIQGAISIIIVASVIVLLWVGLGIRCWLDFELLSASMARANVTPGSAFTVPLD